MVKRDTLTISASSVSRSGLALGWRVEKTLALEAEVSHLRHHISFLSRRLHLLAPVSYFLRYEIDDLH